MKCEECGSINLIPTGTTEKFPHCNTWTCEVCHHVMPEGGSMRLADAYLPQTEEDLES